MHCGGRLHVQNACYVILWNIAHFIFVYDFIIIGNMLLFEKNPIMISPYSMFEVDKLPYDEFF
jgi:hypothetical protein